MIMKIRKMLLCSLVVQLLFISLAATSYAATCSNNWRSPSSQTMENEIMSASMTEYANIERYFSIKQGWKTTHIYFLRGTLLVKGLDDDEIKYDDIFWLPMVFMQGGVLSKAFPQGPCSITQKTPIALNEAEGEVVPKSQGVIEYDYTLTGKQNVKHFKGVMKFTPQEAAPSDDTVVKGFKIVNYTKPYTVIGSKDMPVTTLGELRRALDAKKTPKEREKQAQRYQELSDIFAGKDTTKDTMKSEGIIVAPQQIIDSKDNNELYPLHITYKNWGYVNKSGRVVIEPLFDRAHFFQGGGLASVRIDRKWGVIDKTGRFVIAPQYEDIGPFRDGLACVRKNGKIGFINESGKIIVPIEGDDEYLPEYEKGVAAFRIKDKIYYVDKNGKFITKEQFWEARQYKLLYPRPMQKNNKWGFVNDKNEFILETQYDHIYKEKDGLFLVKKGDLYGFIDKKGNVVINLQFEDAHNFNDGLAAVKQNGKYGFIDKTGRFVIEPQFDDVRSYRAPDAGSYENRNAVSFVGGIASVQVNKQWGVIDKTGRYIATPQFEAAFSCRPSSGIVQIKKNGKWGLMDRTGKIVIEPQYNDVETDLFHEYAIVSKDTLEGSEDKNLRGIIFRKGVIHRSGKIILPTQYRNIYIFPNFAHPDIPTVLRLEKEFPLVDYMDASGNVFVMTDKVCGQYVVKNSKGEITWPKNIKELCGQKN